ncbi:hypothetical protein [Kribbella kalugense]|uniref:Uncharacterized protein n=1 Tax=Kribbella kalugense TaxID=2512221 RepID=A0A4V3G8E7_9ACTN|nr:hypothetical protein [Kribbella kalugense]TDW22654.1 hypothetical protein EV650_1491 [Kribbella kalugense]
MSGKQQAKVLLRLDKATNKQSDDIRVRRGTSIELDANDPSATWACDGVDVASQGGVASIRSMDARRSGTYVAKDAAGNELGRVKVYAFSARNSLAFVVAVWIVLAVGFLSWGLAAPSLGNVEQGTPTGNAQATCAPSDPEAKKALATVAARGDPAVSIPFGRGLNSQTRVLEYVIDHPSGLIGTAETCLRVESSQFLRSTADATLRTDMITTQAVAKGTRLLISVTVNRSRKSTSAPGAYTGSITVTDPRVERVDIPMTISLAYPFWQVPLGLVCLILLPATLYVWLLKGSFTGEKGKWLSFEDFASYLLSRNGILAVGVGTVAAGGGFAASYLGSATWDADAKSLVALAGAAFSAFVAAATAVTAAGSDQSALSSSP